MDWLNIATGKPFDGAMPTEIEIPSLEDIGDVTLVLGRTVTPSDKEWGDALVRWMYVRGFATEEAQATGNDD